MIRDRRRQIIDYSIIAVVLIVVAVLFWPSMGGSEDIEPGPDGVAEEFSTPTEEPDVRETATPEPTPEDDTEFTALCVPGDATQVLANFVQRFNAGDLDALARMLPSEGLAEPSTHVAHGMEQRVLHGFSSHGSELMTQPDQVLDYLAERHDAGEFWRLKEYRLSRMYRDPDSGNPELDEAHAVIQRSSDEFHTHEMQGRAVINCVQGLIVMWEFVTDDPDLAVPIDVDEFLAAVGPYGIAEMRELRMVVSTDLRPDGGTLQEWDIRRSEANSPSGLYVERVTVDTLDGERLVTYVYDGQGWHMNQRGWEATGDLTGRTVLPAEIMMTRLEPSVTADLIRANRSEIPDEGTFIITKEFIIAPELRSAFSLMDGSGDVEGLVEIEIEDRAIKRTRYRLIGESGIHFTAPEIRWIEIERAEHYDGPRFYMPPGPISIGRQFEIPPELDESMTFTGNSEHQDGIAELFELDWQGMPLEIRIMPSRGGITHIARGHGWDPAWRHAEVELDGVSIVTAESTDQPVPTHALWDTGTYRFELSVSPDSAINPERWNLAELEAVVMALTAERE